jgi:hypothetical protein
MADSAHVAEEFLDAWTTKDFEPGRTLLKDDLQFEGPIHRVSAGKISWVTVAFDARPFAPLFEAQGH